jgi:hypothetical protein
VSLIQTTRPPSEDQQRPSGGRGTPQFGSLSTNTTLRSIYLMFHPVWPLLWCFPALCAYLFFRPSVLNDFFIAGIQPPSNTRLDKVSQVQRGRSLIITVFTKYYYSDQIQNGPAAHVARMPEMRTSFRILVANLKGWNHWGGGSWA